MSITRTAGIEVPASAFAGVPPPRHHARVETVRPGRRWTPAVSTLLLVLGTVIGLDAAVLARGGHIGDAGLLRTLPIAYFVGVGLVIVAAVAGVPPRGRWSACWTVACIGSLAVLLHGLPGIVEPNPRFSVAWLHVGFIDEVARKGQFPALDARFSWAGFFSGGAVVQRAAGGGELLWLVRYAPLAVDLFACWGIAILGSLLGMEARRRLLAMTLFLLVNWSGQDYLSPQGTTFCIVLAVLAVVVAFFRACPRRRAPRLARLLRPEPVSVPKWELGTRALVYSGCLVVILALAVGHQLSPLFLAVILLLMSITGAARVRGLGAAALVVTFAWVAFGATAYWLGHLDQITASIGSFGTAVQTNVSARTGGGDFGRKLAVYSRIGLTGLMWGVAFLTVFVAWLRRRTPLVLFCMLVAPIPMFVAQSYGGEMLIRIYLFTLPAATLLVAGLLDARHLRGWFGRLVVALGLVALVPTLVLARFGNERYEQVTSNDKAILEALYAVAPYNSRVYVANRQTVQYWQRVSDVRFRQLDDLDPKAVIGQIKAEHETGSAYVLLSESQSAFGEQVFRQGKDWMAAMEQSILATGAFHVLDRDGGSVLLEYTGRYS
jgi:hypothetical protein